MEQQKLSVFLDGQPVAAKEVDGLQDSSFTFRRTDSAGEAALSYSGELTFYGSARDYLFEQIINAPAPHLARVTVSVFDNCCKDENGQPFRLFFGYAEGADLQWCEVSQDGVCSVTLNVKDGSPEAEKLALLRNVTISQRGQKFGGTEETLGEDSFRAAPFFPYCLDPAPRWLFEFILVLGWLVSRIIIIIGYTLAPLIAVWNGFIGALDGIVPGDLDKYKIDFDGNDDTNIFEELRNFDAYLQNLLTACGRKHKAPFVHSYLQNLCDLTGLTLKSSLFQPGQPLHNLTRLDASFKHGKFSTAGILASYNANRPNLNGVQFLEELRDLNIEWRIVGTELQIERKGSFTDDALLDLREGTHKIAELCYGFTDAAPAAFGVYEYAQDGQDKSGDEARPEWSGGVINWNTPPNPAQRGAYQKTLQYSAALFRNDRALDSESKLPIDKPFIQTLYPALNASENALILKNHTATFPKLLLWDGLSATTSAKVISNPVSGEFDYNVPMWLTESYTQNNVSITTLYERLFAVDNPRQNGLKLRNYTLSLEYTCALLRSLSVNKTIVFKNGAVGDISEIVVNPGSRMLTISGKV